MFAKGTTLSSLCQFGHTKIFIRKQLSQSLEALREIKLEDMKRSAVLVQSIARMYFAKNRIVRFFGGFLRLQAAWRSVYYRTRWLKRRNAILTIQWFARGGIIRRNYLKRLVSAKGKYSSEGAAREWSTVVDIYMTPPSFKPVALSSPRSPLSKTPKQVFF